MTTNHHTPYASKTTGVTGTRFRATEMNNPLSDLDTAITTNATAITGKAATVHAHDDLYFTETELSVSAGGGAVHWDNVTNKPTVGTGDGTVTSVALSLPTELTVTGSPITGAGTLTGAWAVQVATKVLAGPISGADATPAFRVLAQTDLPQQPVGWPMFVPGTMADDMLIFAIIPAFTTTIPVNLAGTTVRKTVNPVAPTTITLNKNGTPFGTVGISAAGVVTLTSAAGASFNGTTDELTATGPATADTALTNLGIMLKGWR